MIQNRVRMSKQEAQKIKNWLNQGYCSEYMETLKSTTTWSVLTRTFAPSMQKNPCLNPIKAQEQDQKDEKDLETLRQENQQRQKQGVEIQINSIDINPSLIDRFNSRVGSIIPEIKAKIAQLTIDSNKTAIESVQAPAENYDLTKELTKQYNKLREEIITKINDLKADTDESVIKSVNKSSTNFDLISEFDTKYNEVKQKIVLKAKCIEAIKEKYKADKILSRATQEQTVAKATLKPIKTELEDIKFLSLIKLAKEKKFYTALDLNSDATLNEIKSKWRKVVRDYLHPDSISSNTYKDERLGVSNYLKSVIDAKRRLENDPVPVDSDQAIINSISLETKAEKEAKERVQETQLVLLSNKLNKANNDIVEIGFKIESIQQKSTELQMFIQTECLDSGIITIDLYGQLTNKILNDDVEFTH